MTTANYAWGKNDYGLLGTGSTTSNLWLPTAIALSVDLVAASSDRSSSLFLTSDGNVYAAGSNATFALGTAVTDASNHPTPQAIYYLSRSAGVLPIVKIGLGLDTSPHNYWALDNAGNLYAWGQNTYGCFGNGSTSVAGIPTRVATGVVDFVGGHHTVVLKAGGVVQTAGRNDYGQLGDGTTTERHSWTTVTPTSGTVVGIAAGGGVGHTLLLMADGTVLGAGCSNAATGNYGQLGNSTAVNSSWITVSFPSGVTEVWACSGDSYARLSSGAVYACGYNPSGELGVAGGAGTIPGSTYTPTQVVEDSSLAGARLGQAARGGAQRQLVMIGPPNSGMVYLAGNINGGAAGDGVTDPLNNPPHYSTVLGWPQPVPNLFGVQWVGCGGWQTMFAGTGAVSSRKPRSFATIY